MSLMYDTSENICYQRRPFLIYNHKIKLSFFKKFRLTFNNLIDSNKQPFERTCINSNVNTTENIDQLRFDLRKSKRNNESLHLYRLKYQISPRGRATVEPRTVIVLLDRRIHPPLGVNNGGDMWNVSCNSCRSSRAREDAVLTYNIW